jgi:hypothetical protein
MIGGLAHAPALHRGKQDMHVLQLDPAADAVFPLHFRSLQFRYGVNTK